MDKIEGKFKDLPLRTGVGIILLNKENKVFVAKRIDNPKNFWQMPQGGVDDGEDYLAAAYRELEEETSIKNVKLIPDGNGYFTKQMGMLISKDHLGFGNRSWRYMAVITDGIVEKWWEEPGINNDGSDDDPYIETMPEKCLEYLASGSE